MTDPKKPNMTDLHEAATALYMAGRWSCDRKVDESLLWANLRDALSLPPGRSPAPSPERLKALEDLEIILNSRSLGAWGVGALRDTLAILVPETRSMVFVPQS